MTAPVPPAGIRGNDWRSLDPSPPEDFNPTIPVTVVIPYYEAPGALELTLAALERQTYPRELFEVVIVDDGSTIPLRTPGSSPLTIRLFRRQDLGFGLARARNLGARMADHPILVFLDCDMLPEGGWLSAHARWHHTASDLLTLGFRAHVAMDGIDASAIRNRQGGLRGLLEARSIDRPEWIEFHMARTDELTSTADDIFRVVTGGNLGVSRWFFEQLEGFDESFDRWAMEDTEFGYRGYTLGAPLVPVREAFCWHQGGRAAPDAAKKAALELQRAKVSHLIAHPDFRVDSPGRSFSVPRFVVTVDPLDRSPRMIHRTAEDVLKDPVHDLVVWVGDRPGDSGYEWLRNSLGPDPRVHIGPLGGAIETFPHSPFHVTLPAGMVCEAGTLGRLNGALGAAAAAVGRLPDGEVLSIARAWALHRSLRVGKALEDVGEVVAVDTRDLAYQRGGGPPDLFATPAWRRSKAARVLRQLAGVRSPGKAWAFLRWITAAARIRSATALRRTRPLSPLERRRHRRDQALTMRQAQYPLGIEIAVVGGSARSVFAVSDRVHHTTEGMENDLILADGDEAAHHSGSGSRVPVVNLSECEPLLSVPAFDPEQINPLGWVRHAGTGIGALGSRGLPPAIEVDTVVRSTDHERLSGLHHLEDVGAFHADTTRRAATLASLAATGAVVHVVEDDSRLEARLGTDLYRLMRDERIREADAGRRERTSIRMRRAALAGHSLVARARQVAQAAGLPGHPGIPEVSIILPTRRPHMLGQVLRTVASQTYPRLELVLALHGSGFPDTIEVSDLPFGVEVLRVPAETSFGVMLNQATEAAGGKLVAKMDDDDHYGVEHVWDLVLAHQFSKAELVAKGAEFVHLVDSGRTIHRFAGGGESDAGALSIAGGAMLISGHDLEEAGGWRRIDTAVDQALARDVARIGGGVYRTHGHGYILVRHGDGHTWSAPDSYFLSQAQDTRPGCDLAFAGIE